MARLRRARVQKSRAADSPPPCVEDWLTAERRKGRMAARYTKETARHQVRFYRETAAASFFKSYAKTGSEGGGERKASRATSMQVTVEEKAG